jgi:phytoene desaturase
MAKRVVIIGAGFGGMSSAAYLAQAGYEVTVIEKNAKAGGRAAVLEREGYTFDLGPSWYMMPDVFEEFFADFGKQVSDYYVLKTLEPSYRTFDDHDEPLDIGGKEQATELFDRVQQGAGKRLEQLLSQSESEYNTVRERILPMDWLSRKAAFEPGVLELLAKPSMLRSYHSRVVRHIKDQRLQRILEFMTVFMGGSPQNIPGMYTLLAHAGIGTGIPYPKGGFGAVARGFEELCKSLGVTFMYNTEADKIIASEGKIKGVRPLRGESLACDIVVANADYQHVQTRLLDSGDQDVPAHKWPRKTMSPSALVVCLGVKKQLPNLLHHNLFFDTGWKQHFDDVFVHKQWTTNPLFYLCAPSKTDPKVAPKGRENLFILAPQPAGSQPDDKIIQKTTDNIIARIGKKTGEEFAKDIEVKEVYAHDYFKTTFNAYQGNAFGLAHTFFQSAFFRPRMKSRKVAGLYFAGQYTNPGTGVPMVILSGKNVARVVANDE